MYLSNIKLWNFRKFGTVGDMDLLRPNLNLSFTKGLNVLIGENDSGKSAILEAIKMVLKTVFFIFLSRRESFLIALRKYYHGEEKTFSTRGE